MDDAIHLKAQRRITGRNANRWGHKAARMVMEKIGAQRTPRNNSNECHLGEESVVIKLVKGKSTSVKISYRMLWRIQAVIGAFEGADGEFHLWKISTKVLEENMRKERVKFAPSRWSGVVGRRIFEEKGQNLGVIPIPLDLE